MSIEQTLAEYFKPEDRKKGADLSRKDLIVISCGSDSDVKAFVKDSTACRVSLNSGGVTSSTFTSSCTCSQARKGRLCKHVWAVLLKLEDKGYDFLEGKIEIEAPSVFAAATASAPRAKNDEFKKQMYQRQKERNKEIRDKKQSDSGTQCSFYPKPVQEALAYFKDNGFPLEPIEPGELLNAKKILSRVFHPDKGGSHEEAITLNMNFEIIEDYLKS